MTTLTATDQALNTTQTDAIVVVSRPGAPGAATVTLLGAEHLPTDTVEHLTAALTTLRARGRADEVLSIPAVPGLAAPLVVVTGLGGSAEDAVTAEPVRRAVGAAIRSLSGREKVAVVAPSADPALAVAAAEGAGLAAYDFRHHRGSAARAKAAANGATGPVAAVTLHGAVDDETLHDGVARAEIVGQANSWVRDLVNTSPNELFPASFAERINRAVETTGLPVGVTILDEDKLAEASCGGILGVGQGSSRPPRIVVLRYAPEDAASQVALVGKGITFDSGGLSLKTATGMITMKCDMAGAAAVAAVVLAAARLELPVAVSGYLCLAENMPSGTAQRPGDVVTMHDGQTVEVINTDAEGRLVMADGLCLASEDHPDAIIDVATLTGAMIVALGNRTAGVLANDDDLQGELTLAAAQAGEAVWPLPIAAEIRATMDSLVADVKHIGEQGSGGGMAAAAFLREFVGKDADGDPIPWAHLDIAGPAYNDGAPYGYTPKGGTGYGLRTLLAFLEGRA